MSHILHLGHQPNDLAGILPANISTDTDFFFSDFDVDGIRFFAQEDAAPAFSKSFTAPTGDLWMQFFFRSPSWTPEPQASDAHFLVFYDASDTVIARIAADRPNDDWRPEVYGDTTGSGALLGIATETGYWIDIQLVVGANIEMRVYFSGLLVAEASAANSGGVGKPVRFAFPNKGLHSSSNKRHWGYAHFAVLDDVSTIGRRFIRRTPFVAGFHTAWAGGVDALADGRTDTRMASDTVGQRQSMTTQGPVVPSGSTVASVHLRAVAQGGTDGVDQLAGSVRIGSTDYDAPLQTLDIFSLGDAIYTWDNNPDTSSPWTGSDLPDEIGMISGAS